MKETRLTRILRNRPNKFTCAFLHPNKLSSHCDADNRPTSGTRIQMFHEHGSGEPLPIGLTQRSPICHTQCDTTNICHVRFPFRSKFTRHPRTWSSRSHCRTSKDARADSSTSCVQKVHSSLCPNTLCQVWQITIFYTAYPLSHFTSKHRGKLYGLSGSCFTQHLGRAGSTKRSCRFKRCDPLLRLGKGR